ncbi:hypothetical protein SDRG_14766 [Saprolegnia diclina VS20]|uniref:Uncharacterized protein n=1 Tax=Saprolegnia diclina (strain VS20) TaxID=1156394 RepID=T0RD09_SAPDV|nr:hypothetical protein SDRG_14766 [Saprolegnia diclina VS20]EQC27442.1 hypothetical protein SDRG_14766 [Saprolegnia diclina VS20]|eukprot:XP_008619142.1 hypothetical protein SDRG_14766 [Saprolegnia diclina VS20]
MADLMLQSEFSKDPNKPFSSRVDDISASFDAILKECSELFLLMEKADPATREAGAEAIKKKIDAFNSVCDELYKEIMRRKEKLVNHNEKGITRTIDLHRQIQTAGNLAQMMGEFRHFLHTSTPPPHTQPQ